MANSVKKDTASYTPLFGTDNIRWMAIGLAAIVVGLLLMAGGKSHDLNQFNPGEVYSWRRVTLAPILIVAGLVIEIYAIIKKSAPKEETAK